MSSTALPIAHYVGAGLAGATITALGYSLATAYAARVKRTPVRVLITGAAGDRGHSCMGVVRAISEIRSM